MRGVRLVGEQVDDRNVDRACHPHENVVLEDAGGDDPAHRRECAGDVFRGLALVNSDLLLADVDRVAAKCRDRDLDRRPGPGRCLLKQRGHGPAFEQRRYRGRSRFPFDGAVEDGGESGRVEVVDFEELPRSRSHLGGRRREHSREDRDRGVDLVVAHQERRRQPQRTRRHRVDDEARVEAPLRDVFGVDAVRQFHREQQAEAAHRHHAGLRLERGGQSGAGPFGTRGHLLALHDIEHGECGAAASGWPPNVVA